MCLILPLIQFFSLQDSQSGKGESSGPVIAVSRKPRSTFLKSRQRIAYEIKRTIKLRPNHHGLAIVVSFYPLYLMPMLTKKLRFAVYKPRDKRTLKSHMQAVDLVELKHYPIVVVLDGYREDHLLGTNVGYIDIKEDIMAPLFPPIATHLADNPKIFLFVGYSRSSERHALHLKEPIGENYIVGYITCRDVDDMLEVTPILEEELASPFMSVQEIFASISDKLPSTATMSVIDHLKEPVYLHPHGPGLMETHSRLQGIMSIMYSHTSHHASLPTCTLYIGSIKEPDTGSPRLEQLTSDKLQIDEGL